MDRRDITGVVSLVRRRHVLLVPMNGTPQLITHEINGRNKGDVVMYDEFMSGQNRKRQAVNVRRLSGSGLGSASAPASSSSAVTTTVTIAVAATITVTVAGEEE